MERIIIKDTPDNVKKFLQMEKGLEKRVAYDAGFNGWIESNILRDGDLIHYSSCNNAISPVRGYSIKRTEKTGFTFKDGKLSVWFGKTIHYIRWVEVFQALRIDWFLPPFSVILTKSTIEKILSGKITNPLDLVKAYIKVSRLKCSPKLLKDVLQKRRNFSTIKQGLRLCKNPDHWLEYCLEDNENTVNRTLGDMFHQAFILEEKIDIKWSQKRMLQEHNRMTKIIMDIKAKLIEDIKYEHINEEVIKKDGYIFTPITTRKELYKEASEMKHCVYTNYEIAIDNGSYVVYKIEGKERATLGISILKVDKDLVLRFDQVHSIGNSHCSEELKEISKEISKNIKVFPKKVKDNFSFNTVEVEY